MSSPLPHAARFRLACFEFSLTFTQAAELPVYKGAIVHGALGLALARIGTQFRDFFYQPTAPAHWQDAHKSPPRPYLIIPPADDKTHYAAGDSLSLGIVLFGTAIDYFMVVFAALAHLGELMGLGQQRSRFYIDRISQLGALGQQPLYQHPHWLASPLALTAEQLLTNLPPAPTAIQLKHSTRLRLKADNELLYSAPPFALLMQRLLSRLNALASLYNGGILITPEHKHQLLILAEHIHTEHSTLTWHDWQRHSQRSHSTMPFGGLMGTTVYSGELAPFIPYLVLGQWVGIGGKTSFGLGLYELAEWSPHATANTEDN